MTTDKTWAQLDSEIRETFRKWHVWNYEIISPFATMKAMERRKAIKAGLLLEQRQVEVSFVWENPDTGHAQRLKIVANARDDPHDNLDALVKCIEMLRLAEVRGVQHILTVLNRQMYPPPAKQQVPPPPPPPKQPPLSSGPYAVLHLTNDAPLEIAEAAYRAAMRQQHPDVGGSHEAAKRLNAAIEQIREAHAASR